MRITEMSFEKKVLTGQYEHEMLKVTALLSEGESDPNTRVKQLVSFVQTRGETKLDGVATVVKTELREAGVQGGGSSTSAAVTESAEDKKKREKAEKAAAKAAEKAAAEKSSAGEPTTSKEEVKTTTSAEDKKEEVKTEPEKKTKKSVPYSRTNETHKKLVGELLDSRYPGWRSSPNKYVEASKKLEGQDLLNDEGLVLDSFKEKFDAEVK